MVAVGIPDWVAVQTAVIHRAVAAADPYHFGHRKSSCQAEGVGACLRSFLVMEVVLRSRTQKRVLALLLPWACTKYNPWTLMSANYARSVVIIEICKNRRVIPRLVGLGVVLEEGQCQIQAPAGR